MDTMVSFQVLDHSMIASHALSVTTVIQTLFQFQMLIVKNQLESAKLEASALSASTCQHSLQIMNLVVI